MIKRPSREIVLLQILVIFIVPIFLLYYNILDIDARFFLLAFSALVMYSIIRRERWNYRDLGLRVDNIKSALPYYLSATLLFIGILFVLDSVLNINPNNTPTVIAQRLLLFIPVSVFQEFAFSVFLLKRLQFLFGRSFLMVFINATIFTYIHIIYDLPPAAAIFLFVGSVIASIVYLRKPNFLLVSIAHSLANITAVLLGFFV
ncbi:MAG: CPBP family intramembrane glutamic endopeptidase [Candidatus Paceibacterota bacterium]